MRLRRAKKFKGLLCFDGECEFWSAASALQNNALNAFSHLQYGNVEDLFSLRARTKRIQLKHIGENYLASETPCKQVKSVANVSVFSAKRSNPYKLIYLVTDPAFVSCALMATVAGLCSAAAAAAAAASASF